MSSFDAHEKAPEAIREVFKYYQRLPREEIDAELDIVDFQRSSLNNDRFRAFFVDMSSSLNLQDFPVELAPLQGAAIESKRIPGLYVIPRLFPANAQAWLLDRLLHRDLAKQQHLTNLHKHYAINYDHSLLKAHSVSDADATDAITQQSFFHTPPASQTAFDPLDPTVHKPILVAQALKRKLRWVTLGGQYDWTAKVYPEGPSPAFPSDIAALIRHVFPGTKPEAAIVNIYSPGDTLSLHRDVSEEATEGLVSISMGCDGLFVIGIVGDDGVAEHLTIRLRSGDAVLMSEKARHAWHGVPRILNDTCPPDIGAWPAHPRLHDQDSDIEDSSDPFEQWRDWMLNKRINLNIRQMQKHIAT